MKKIRSLLSLALCIVMMLTCAVPAFAAAKKGDADGNGRVTVDDARKILRAAIGLGKLSEAQAEASDVDYDGEVTIADARIVLRMAIGLETEETAFDRVLYDHSHALLGTAKKYAEDPLIGIVGRNFQKWCTIYTIQDVLRPVLQKAGYKQSAIDKLAPNQYSADLWYKLMRNNGVPYLGALTSAGIASGMTDIYTPSLLMGYYQEHEADKLCKIYNFVTYYDNEITREIKEADAKDVAEYHPQVGDILFITNKTMFIHDGEGDPYNYIIHTAQIIKVNPDGTFLTTEGAIIEPSEGDGVARVREREYYWVKDQKTNIDGYGNKLENVPEQTYSTYQFRYNSTVIVLAAVRPDWSITE